MFRRFVIALRFVGVRCPRSRCVIVLVFRFLRVVVLPFAVAVVVVCRILFLPLLLVAHHPIAIGAASVQLPMRYAIHRDIRRAGAAGTWAGGGIAGLENLKALGADAYITE